MKNLSPLRLRFTQLLSSISVENFLWVGSLGILFVNLYVLLLYYNQQWIDLQKKIKNIFLNVIFCSKVQASCPWNYAIMLKIIIVSFSNIFCSVEHVHLQTKNSLIHSNALVWGMLASPSDIEWLLRFTYFFICIWLWIIVIIWMC